MKTIVSEKGQITIPKACRDRLGLKAGTTLDVIADHGRLVAVKQRVIDGFHAWRGKGKLPGKMSVDDYIKKARG